MGNTVSANWTTFISLTGFLVNQMLMEALVRFVSLSAILFLVNNKVPRVLPSQAADLKYKLCTVVSHTDYIKGSLDVGGGK